MKVASKVRYANISGKIYSSIKAHVFQLATRFMSQVLLFLASRRGIALGRSLWNFVVDGKYLRLPRARSRRNRRVCGVIGIEPRKLFANVNVRLRALGHSCWASDWSRKCIKNSHANFSNYNYLSVEIFEINIMTEVPAVWYFYSL